MNAEEFIDFKCPCCGEVVSFPPSAVGRVQECPLCLESLIASADPQDPGRKLPIPIITPRLRLRRLDAGDWRDLLELFADEETFRFEEGRPMEEEEILRWLESDSHVRLTTPQQPFHLGLQLRDELIGFLALNFSDAHRLQAALSVFLKSKHQRQGFATEAVSALLNFCFKEIRLHRVTASCSRENLGACRLWEKAGMKCEAEFRQDRWINDHWTNTLWFARLDTEHGQTSIAP